MNTLKKVHINELNFQVSSIYPIFTDLYGDDDNNNDNYAVEQFGTNQFKTRFHVAQ